MLYAIENLHKYNRDEDHKLTIEYNTYTEYNKG